MFLLNWIIIQLCIGKIYYFKHLSNIRIKILQNPFRVAYTVCLFIQFNFFCFVLISSALFFFTGNYFGDTIQPWFPEKHGSEDENVTLSCNYSLTSGTSVTIQWYR